MTARHSPLILWLKAIEAVNKASAGDSITVTLGKDQIVTETIQIQKDLNVTLDLGGKTLRGRTVGIRSSLKL